MGANQPLLSIATSSKGDTVSIHADLEGLQILERAVSALRAALVENACEHDHLRSKEWAGRELTVSMLEAEKNEGYKSVHHVKLYAWNKEWKGKHGL